MKKPTIYSIAKQAGLSPATVSNVLNNQGGVSEKTIAKVLAIAKECNYQPQQRKQLNQTIGVVLFHITDKPLSHPFSSLLLSGACAETFERDRTLTFISPAKVINLSPDELHCFFINHGIAGLLLCNITDDDPFCEKIKKSGIPFAILANKADDEYDYLYVTTDNYESTYELMDYVACLGHKEIAFLGLITDQIESHRERLQAYLDVLKKHNLLIRNEFIINLPDVENHTIKNELTRLMSRQTRPTAIFYCSEELINIFSVLKNMNLSIPDQISVAGFNLESNNELLSLEISAVIQPTYEIGRTAVKSLIDKIENKKTSSTILKNKIIYGSTVKQI